MATKPEQARLGVKAPELQISEWAQGPAIRFEQLRGRVILVEVFQLNCPGCFLYALPQAIALHQSYAKLGLTVLGLATAFEDFDKNTLENLIALTTSGRLVGETFRALEARSLTEQDCWLNRLPFPVAMDQLVPAEQPVNEDNVERFIQAKIPDFRHQPITFQHRIREQIKSYLQKLEYHAQSFELFDLQGTPSQLLIDKLGILRACRFGEFPDLESQIQGLLAEPESVV